MTGANKTERVQAILHRITMAAGRGEWAKADERALIERVEAGDRAIADLEAARAEVEAKVRQARNDALEEAAEIADRHFRGIAGTEDMFCQGAEAQARIIAREIRAAQQREVGQ